MVTDQNALDRRGGLKSESVAVVAIERVSVVVVPGHRVGGLVSVVAP